MVAKNERYAFDPKKDAELIKFSEEFVDQLICKVAKDLSKSQVLSNRTSGVGSSYPEAPKSLIIPVSSDTHIYVPSRYTTRTLLPPKHRKNRSKSMDLTKNKSTNGSISWWQPFKGQTIGGQFDSIIPDRPDNAHAIFKASIHRQNKTEENYVNFLQRDSQMPCKHSASHERNLRNETYVFDDLFRDNHPNLNPQEEEVVDKLRKSILSGDYTRLKHFVRQLRCNCYYCRQSISLIDNKYINSFQTSAPNFNNNRDADKISQIVSENQDLKARISKLEATIFGSNFSIDSNQTPSFKPCRISDYQHSTTFYRDNVKIEMDIRLSRLQDRQKLLSQELSQLMLEEEGLLTRVSPSIARTTYHQRRLSIVRHRKGDTVSKLQRLNREIEITAQKLGISMHNFDSYPRASFVH
ncbi:hypothetical protein Ciccas_006707 [Cichlidogyrus casuarinus]|uniref:Uncharacterized protein n=1 Tax=Cichlidogyrus casuarinus TaxID=1844966 RepID=A0ABD2Q4Z1_9PLAT